METALKAVDHASQQGDRYIFLCLLVIIFLGVFWTVRWLVGRLEKQTTLLEGLFRDANAGREHASNAMVLNTDAIKDNTSVMHRTCTIMERFERDARDERLSSH